MALICLTGCVTKHDLTNIRRELHRSVITTISQHEKLREHPYRTWGQVMDITEDDSPPMNNAGFITIVQYHIAIVPNQRLLTDEHKTSPNRIVYTKGFRHGEEVTREFSVGERVCLTGNVTKYPWEWAKDGKAAADSISNENP